MMRLPWWLRWYSICLQCGRPVFDPWVRKIPWRRKWQPTPVLLPRKFHGWRTLVGYSPWGHKESDMTEWLHLHINKHIVSQKYKLKMHLIHLTYRTSLLNLVYLKCAHNTLAKIWAKSSHAKPAVLKVKSRWFYGYRMAVSQLSTLTIVWLVWSCGPLPSITRE